MHPTPDFLAVRVSPPTHSEVIANTPRDRQQPSGAGWCQHTVGVHYLGLWLSAPGVALSDCNDIGALYSFGMAANRTHAAACVNPILLAHTLERFVASRA